MVFTVSVWDSYEKTSKNSIKFFMKKLLSILIFFFLFESSAKAEDSFILYKKPLLSGISLIQTDDTTSITYHGDIIKTYRNEEFPFTLLPHGPNEDIDCYNSLVKNTPSTTAKNIIWKEYLKHCLILQAKLIFGKYILFYAPSVEGNRVSIYDIRQKRFYHAMINTATSVRSIGGGLVFFTRNTQSICARSITLFRDGKTTTLFNDCTLTKSWWPMIEIQSYRVLRKSVIITYFPYKTVGYDSILDKSNRKNIQINF